jgi:hypothetical protein
MRHMRNGIPMNGNPIEEDFFRWLNLDSGGKMILKVHDDREFEEAFFDLFMKYFCEHLHLDWRETIFRLERAVILCVLQKSDCDTALAAAKLGIKYKTLFEKMRRHGIEIHKFPSAQAPPAAPGTDGKGRPFVQGAGTGLAEEKEISRGQDEESG